MLYDVFEFVEGARGAGGRVLVHCSQGVSRSVALVIGYLMWRSGRGYEETFAQIGRASCRERVYHPV